MNAKILNSLMLRPGMSEQDKPLLNDMIDDVLLDVKSYLNYNASETLPDALAPVIKELVLIRFNRDGTEGISNESQSSGGSTSYSDTFPEHVRRVIRKYRRLPR